MSFSILDRMKGVIRTRIEELIIEKFLFLGKMAITPKDTYVYEVLRLGVAIIDFKIAFWESMLGKGE